MSWQTTRVTALKLPNLPFPLEPSGSPAPGCRILSGALILNAAPGTDMFVDPAGAWESGVPDAGRFVGLPPAGDFTLAAQVRVEFASIYDAGVLLLHARERHWAKLCFEYSPQLRPTAVTVVTKGVSDDCNSFEVDGDTLWLRITRSGAAWAFHASADGSWWRLLRYFALGGDAAELVRVGFLAQSPTGAGCAATFDHISFQPGAPKNLRDGTLLWGKVAGGIGVAELAGGVVVLHEVEEVGEAFVARPDLLGRGGEDLAPVRPGGERGQLTFEVGDHGEHRGGVGDPGEVEGDAVPVIARAEPPGVAGHDADLADPQDRGQAVTDLVQGVQRGDGLGDGEQVLGLELVAGAGLELGAEVREPLVPAAGHAELLGAGFRRPAGDRVPGRERRGGGEPRFPGDRRRVAGVLLEPELGQPGGSPVGEQAHAVGAGHDVGEVIV